jgi:hypothetical protein
VNQCQHPTGVSYCRGWPTPAGFHRGFVQFRHLFDHLRQDGITLGHLEHGGYGVEVAAF